MSNVVDLAGTVVRRIVARRFRKQNALPNDLYVLKPPSPQQTANLFAGAWSSQLPLPDVESGKTPLFEDTRIAWLIERAGGVAGFDILELGPLEGGHTTMLERSGAASIEAIDANTLAYLKCLVVKELLGLKAAHFELGDFDAFLENNERRYDMVVACGVLYHLLDPLRTLLNIIRATDRIFIWSHFFDDAAMPARDPRRAWMTGETRRQVLNGESLTYHVRTYGETRHPIGFCGGTQSKSVWLDREEVVELLGRRGFAVETAMVTPDHPHGPAACLYAERA